MPSNTLHQSTEANLNIHKYPDLPFEDRPVLLLFSDDSTLFFALRMRECLRSSDPNLDIKMGWIVNENALSYRQMAQLLPEGPDLGIYNNEFEGLILSQQFRAIITSRFYRGLMLIRRVGLSTAADRPCIIGFLGGLDFFPEKGYFNRRHCDGVYLFPASEISTYKEHAESWNVMWQEVGFGHPTFVAPQVLNPNLLAKRQDIYFFTQALSPSTLRGRIHMLRAMVSIARANPKRSVWVKLRHLPDENKNHLHLEKHDYPSLMNSIENLPANLKVTACTMDEALDNAALGITCTSTAAIDVVRAGIPCMVHLDFIDNYGDDLVAPMRKLFAESGLITSLDDMLHLRASSPNTDWIEDMFCSRDLGDRVLKTISRFNKRPFQVPVTPKYTVP